MVIGAGIYRERIDPARGGTDADHLIGYEAAPGANVVVKGSRLVKTGWRASAGFKLDVPEPARARVKIYERRLDDIDFQGYNPFGMASIMQDRVYLMPKPEELWRHLVRRGMVFVDGRRLAQVELYQELGAKDGAFWCEHDGLAIHVRLPGDADPAGHEVELAVQEQVFAPRTRGLGYIRVKGLTFEHAANGFPVPQRGLVSLSRGHHWIIEDCVLRQANGVALDIGAQDWDMETPAVVGRAIVRRNHIDGAGVCGIAGMAVQDSLIESNLIEHVGDRDVELAWETGGIKLHAAKSCLIRRNVIRHTIHAEAIWLDYENANTRITGNVMGDNAGNPAGRHLPRGFPRAQHDRQQHHLEGDRGRGGRILQHAGPRRLGHHRGRQRRDGRRPQPDRLDPGRRPQIPGYRGPDRERTRRHGAAKQGPGQHLLPLRQGHRFRQPRQHRRRQPLYQRLGRRARRDPVGRPRS